MQKQLRCHHVGNRATSSITRSGQNFTANWWPQPILSTIARYEGASTHANAIYTLNRDINTQCRQLSIIAKQEVRQLIVQHGVESRLEYISIFVRNALGMKLFRPCMQVTCWASTHIYSTCCVLVLRWFNMLTVQETTIV